MTRPITIYNIRGPNGSGKSTLARSCIAGDPAAAPNRPGVRGSPTMVDLHWYSSPTKKDPKRQKAVEGYVARKDNYEVITLGSYRTACGGLDATPNFDAAFNSLDSAVELLHLSEAEHRAIVCEGVISSTVWGSWGRYASELSEIGSAQFAFCYLIPPLEVCLERIRERQRAAGGEKPIKEDLVADKIKAVSATRLKALEAGHIVYDLPAERSAREVSHIFHQIVLDGFIEMESHPGRGALAREAYLATA